MCANKIVGIVSMLMRMGKRSNETITVGSKHSTEKRFDPDHGKKSLSSKE